MIDREIFAALATLSTDGPSAGDAHVLLLHHLVRLGDDAAPDRPTNP